MALLEVNGIFKRFGKTEVLKGIDFSMEKGENRLLGKRQDYIAALPELP